MIIDPNNRPENTLYFVGHEILSLLETHSHKMSFLEIYDQMSTVRKISVSLLQHSLDWLYLIDAVEMTIEGDIQLCT